MILRTLEKILMLVVFSMGMHFAYADACAPPCQQHQPNNANQALYKKSYSLHSGSMAACLKRCELSNCVNGDPACPKTMLFVCKSDCSSNINVYR